jgi:hypothetical protein
MARLKVKRSQHMTEDQRSDEAKFGRCPKGHALPYRTNRGNCTPLFCAGSKSNNQPKAPGPASLSVKAEAKDLATIATDMGADDLAVLDETVSKIAKASTRHKARMAYVKVPEFADAKEREKWVENKKSELVPLALADVEYALKLGDSQERERARKEVLEMTGHGRRDSGGGSTSPLIILTGVTGNPGDNPWIRRIDKDGKELPANATVIDAGEKK